MANLGVLKTHDKAISAHQRGRAGVIKDGVAVWYVNRVKKALKEI